MLLDSSSSSKIIQSVNNLNTDEISKEKTKITSSNNNQHSKSIDMKTLCKASVKRKPSSLLLHFLNFIQNQNNELSQPLEANIKEHLKNKYLIESGKQSNEISAVKLIRESNISFSANMSS